VSLPRYPEYKDSGVEWFGEVPVHWDVLRFQRLVQVAEGQVDPEDARFSSMPLIAPNHVESGTGRLLALESASKQGAESGKYLCHKGDVVYSKIRPALRKVCIAPEPCLCSADMYPLRARSGLSNTFLLWLMLSEQFSSLAVLESQRVAMPKINRESLKDLELLVPPLPEQTVIAAFLDRETAKIDALVAEQERLIELLKEKREAVISHAVTKGLNPDVPMKESGVEWLGEIPKHWEVGPLKRYWTVTDCKHVTAEFVDDGIPVASIREVQGKWVALEDAKRTTETFYEALIEGERRPQPGDLIFSRNATVGEVAQVGVNHPRFAMGQDVVLLRKMAADVSSDYLQHLIRSPVVMEQLALWMIGSTFKRINVDEIRCIIVPSPPPDEQRLIADRLEAAVTRFDPLTAEAQRAIDLLRERRTALISAAVTGQIDVREAGGRAA